MKKTIFSAIILSTCSFSATLSAATLNQWGAVSGVASGSCVGNSCNPLGVFLGGITEETRDGGLNVLSSDTGLTSIVQGDARASAAIDNTVLNLPTLKAIATANNDAWIGGGSFALQGYEFIGAIADTVNLNITFDGTLTNPDGDDATGFAVAMYFFSAADINSVTINADPTVVFGAMSLLASALPDNQKYEFTTHTDGAVNETGSLSLLLNPGDQFYLASGLLATAGGGGAIADAFSTLSASFDPGTENVLNAPTPLTVPEAPTWLLLFFAPFLKRIRAIRSH